MALKFDVGGRGGDGGLLDDGEMLWKRMDSFVLRLGCVMIDFCTVHFRLSILEFIFF